LIGFFQRAEIDVADALELGDAFVGDADAAEMAGVVVGYGLWLGEFQSGEIGPENFVEELHKFVGVIGKFLGGCFFSGIAVE